MMLWGPNPPPLNSAYLLGERSGRYGPFQQAPRLHVQEPRHRTLHLCAAPVSRPPPPGTPAASPSSPRSIVAPRCRGSLLCTAAESFEHARKPPVLGEPSGECYDVEGAVPAATAADVLCGCVGSLMVEEAFRGQYLLVVWSGGSIGLLFDWLFFCLV